MFGKDNSIQNDFKKVVGNYAGILNVRTTLTYLYCTVYTPVWKIFNFYVTRLLYKQLNEDGNIFCASLYGVLTNIISGLGRVGEGPSRMFYDFVLVKYMKQPIFFILKRASASELFSRIMNVV